MLSSTREFVALIVDDDPGDGLLIEAALALVPGRRNVHIVVHGHEAVAFLHRTAPHRPVR